MRIVEEEEKKLPDGGRDDCRRQPMPAEEPESKRDRRPRYQDDPRKRHSCANFFLALAVMLAIVAVSIAYLVFFLAGPLVRSVDALPADFPNELALYQLERAEVKIQSPENKEALMKLIGSLPHWLLEPLAGYLTTDLKTGLAAALKDPSRLPQNLSLDDFWQALGNELVATKTVGLQWSDISQSKQDLYEYYKKQLEENDFTVKEKLSDYEIDLSFFKPGIDGAMSIADSFMNDGNSVVKMTINYLTGN